MATWWIHSGGDGYARGGYKKESAIRCEATTDTVCGIGWDKEQKGGHKCIIDYITTKSQWEWMRLFSLTSLKLIYDQTKCKCISSQKLVAVPNNNTVSKYIKGKALNTQTWWQTKVTYGWFPMRSVA